MVRRVVSTIVGPKTYALVEARVGGLVIVPPGRHAPD
jgi:hypothetical protein